MPTIDPQAALATALNEAQGAAGAVAKGSRNNFHKYKYASAEALIEEGRSALHGAGLALIPDSQSVDLKQDVKDGISVLKRSYTLLHTGGGSMIMTQEWPIIPEKGRPMDKAVASAVTASLGYFLRDLLLMPRVDPADDLDSNTRDSQQRGRDKQPGKNRSRHGDQRTQAKAPVREPRNDAPLPGNWKGLGESLKLDNDGHDSEWNKDRNGFILRLRNLGVKYEDLSAACKAIGMDKPSSVGRKGRSFLIHELEKGKFPDLLLVTDQGPSNPNSRL